MPGARQIDFRSGDRTELLVEFVMNAIAFTTRVPRQEDVGHDLLCALAEPRGEMAWAGPSFAIQTKSDTKPLVFVKEYERAWITTQENPLFIAVGDKKQLRVDLYTTWQRVSAALQAAPGQITLRFERSPGAAPIVLAPDHSQQDIYLGDPIASVTLDEVLDQGTAKGLRDVLRAWIQVDRANIASAHAGVHWAVGPAAYTTNVPPSPDPAQLALFWNANNLPTCARNFGRAAAALRLTLVAAGHPATTERVAALDAAIREWREILDDAAVSALDQHAGLQLG